MFDENDSMTKRTATTRPSSFLPIRLVRGDDVGFEVNLDHDLEHGGTPRIVPTTTRRCPRGPTDRDDNVPIAIAVPLGTPQDDDGSADDDKGSTKASAVITAPFGSSDSGNNDNAIKKSKGPPPSPRLPPKWSVEESSTLVFRRSLAVVCGGTILLGCAVIGILLAKGIRYHHYDAYHYNEDGDW